MIQNEMVAQTTLNVVGILPNQQVIFGKQVVTEDEDKGVIIWDVGSKVPNGYYPIVEQAVYFAYQDAQELIALAA